MNPLTFRLEMVAIVWTAMVAVRMAPNLSSVSLWLKWVHFGLVGIFSIVGIAGVRFLMLFCLRHNRFVQVFSQANDLGIGPVLMQWLAIVFAIASTALLVAVCLLVDFHKKARTAFIVLAFPCGLLYPLVMLTWFSAVGASHSGVFVVLAATLVFLILASFATLFYTSKLVSTQVEFK
jgi:hypothetical protein